MSTAVDLDVDLELGLMEWEMPAIPCESPHHLTGDSHDDGPATHYMLIGHACYGPVGQVIPVCSAYVQHWTRLNKKAWCAWCGVALQPEQLNQTIGPIK